MSDVSHRITSEAALRALYPAPQAVVERKILPRLDAHCRRFIDRSSLVVVATADGEGRCDVSPRGDPAGFVRVLDDATLALPDRKGNNRLDALANVLRNPHVGLLFIVPGHDDTLRVNGVAEIRTDPTLLRAAAVAGRPPRSVLVITVVEAFLHCGRAFKRANAWAPPTACTPPLPRLAEILADQVAADPAERDRLAGEEDEELY